MEELAADRGRIGQASRGEQVSDVLRTRITEGFFRPGDRLPESEVARVLGVSRNTLREAFRLLEREHLLVQELNRGTFVRVPTTADVAHLYRMRRAVECSVVAPITSPLATPDRLAAAVESGCDALGADDGQALGTANIAFHQALVELAGDPRLDELMRGLFAELRLVFHVMDNPRWYHEPYLPRNEKILAALRAGDGPGAAALLDEYLHDAERQLVEAYSTLRGT